MTALLVHAMSFFKAPSGIISSIESILNIIIFFGGGGGRIIGKYLGCDGIMFVCVRSMEGWG